jgi:hypothetical protein
MLKETIGKGPSGSSPSSYAPPAGGNNSGGFRGSSSPQYSNTGSSREASYKQIKYLSYLLEQDGKSLGEIEKTTRNLSSTEASRMISEIKTRVPG